MHPLARQITSANEQPTGWIELVDQPRETPVPEGAGERVAVIAHLSDLHVCDAESPGRQEYLDHYGRRGHPLAPLIGSVGTYRPQETLTVPVALSMVDVVNDVAAQAAAAGRPMDAVVLTGDLTDNAQGNELDWVTTILGGGTVRPASGGSSSSWVGAASGAFRDHYWYPEGHPDGRDQWRRHHGFPTVDGFLEAARADFVAPGLDVDYFGVHGNHDLLLQGTVPPDDELRALVVGELRYTDLAPDQSPLGILEVVPGVGPARSAHTPGSPTEHVVSDSCRQYVESGDFRRLQAGADLRGPDHSFSALITPAVRLIGLDTVNPFGGWQGSLSIEQFVWMARVLDETDEPYVVVASHHPSWNLTNGYAPAGTPSRVMGARLVETLLDQRRVIAWLSGHVHRHAVTEHRREGRVLPEFTSASLIDWPQQSRLLEIDRATDGTLVLTSVPIDHGGPASSPSWDLHDHHHLAGLSRTIARNIPERRERITTLERAAALDPQPATTVLRVPDPATRR